MFICQLLDANKLLVPEPVWKKSIGSITFFANFQYFIAKKVLDPILHCKKCYEVYNMFTIQCCMKIKKWV